MLDSVELRSVITPIVTAPDSAGPLALKEVAEVAELELELELELFPPILFASRTLHVPAGATEDADALAVTVVATVCVTVAPDAPAPVTV